MTQPTITHDQIERTRARDIGMAPPQFAKPEPKTEIRLDFPKDRAEVPRLVISIPLPWGRLYKLWGRIGHHLRRAYPDVCALAREAGKDGR